jgi:hypothetical protein
MVRQTREEDSLISIVKGLYFVNCEFNRIHIGKYYSIRLEQ